MVRSKEELQLSRMAICHLKEINLNHPGFSPQLSMNTSGKAVVVWLMQDQDNSQYSGVVQTSTLDWSIPTALSPGIKAVEARVGVDEDGNTLVIWLRDSNSSTNVYQSLSTDVYQSLIQGVTNVGDNGWSDIVGISKESKDQFISSPQIAVNRSLVNQGVGAAVWQFATSLGAAPIIQGAIGSFQNTTDTFTWSNPLNLSDSSGSASSPQVAVGKEVIWLQSDGVQGASQIVNGEWSDLVTISQKGELQVFSFP